MVHAQVASSHSSQKMDIVRLNTANNITTSAVSPVNVDTLLQRKWPAKKSNKVVWDIKKDCVQIVFHLSVF